MTFLKPVGRELVLRFGQALAVALVVAVLSFAMMEALPGDAAYRIAAGRYGYDLFDNAAAEMVRQELGLDRSLGVRLMAWMGQALTFDLGVSLVSGERVISELLHQFGNSAMLAFTAVALSLVIALPLGVWSGLHPGGIVDRVSLALSMLVRATPAFAIGIVLILLLAVEARLLPVAGHASVAHIVLPSLTLALGLAAVSSRVARDAVAATAASEHIAFARLKGLPAPRVLFRHLIPNAAIPVIAYVGVQLVYLIEGVVVIESLFAWPGIGHALVHAIFERDVPMVQGTALTLGLAFVVLNTAVDLVSRLIDPRRAF